MITRHRCSVEGRPSPRQRDAKSNERGHGERGFAGGTEVLPFGILVFLGAMVLAVNAWSVIHTKMALDASGREYLRAYTEAADVGAARAAGSSAVDASISSRLGDGIGVTIRTPNGEFGPCRLATVELVAVVPALRAPFLGEFGETTVRSTQSELIDPFAPLSSGGLGLEGTVCE